jgi:hypothetical protein
MIPAPPVRAVQPIVETTSRFQTPQSTGSFEPAPQSPQPAWAQNVQTAQTFPPISGGIPTPRGPEYAVSLPQRLDSPPAKRKQSSLSGGVVAGIVAAVAVTAGAVYFLNQHHGGPVRVSAHTTIQMPSQIDGLPQIRGSLTDQLQRINNSSSIPKPHLVGFYGANASNPTAFVMVAKYPQTAAQVAHNLSTSLRTLDENIGNVIFWKDADPGPLGGQMRCATVVQSAQSISVCMFEDTDVIGMTFSYSAGTTTGPDAVTLRNAVEHSS